MKKILIILPLLFLLGLPFTGSAQVVVGNQEYDIDYLTPKTYEIGGITFQGAENYDTRMVLLVAGLQVGDRIRVPGDKLATAVDRLWKQGLFEDVQIYVTRIQGDLIFFEIVLKSRPKMSMFKINGVKKSDNDKLKEEMNIATGDVVTENLLTTSRNRIRAFYLDKGYSNVSVTTEVEKDTIVAKNENRVNVIFNVKPGNRVKIDSLIIEGNSQISTNMLLQQMKNTHDVNYYKKFFFWTKGFWSRSKYQESKFNEDLESIITYYNENGFRDARVVWDTVYPATRIEDGKEVGEDRLIVKVRLHEGNKFVFRNITFSGNTAIGTWTTPKGSDLELYITEITIISRNLVIRILPKYPSNKDYYDISICGRGYYASKDQLQMADFFLSSLAENPGVDPLEGIIESEDHTYYF